jgi:hypothetical protein
VNPHLQHVGVVSESSGMEVDGAAGATRKLYTGHEGVNYRRDGMEVRHAPPTMHAHTPQTFPAYLPPPPTFRNLLPTYPMGHVMFGMDRNVVGRAVQCT